MRDYWNKIHDACRALGTVYGNSYKEVLADTPEKARLYGVKLGDTVSVEIQKSLVIQKVTHGQ